MILAIDGAYHRNTIQIIGLSIFNALFLAWAALQVGLHIDLVRLIPRTQLIPDRPVSPWQISELRSIFKDTSQIDIDGDTSVSEAIYDIPVDALTGTMLGVIAFVELGLVTVSWFVYKEMGWQIYHGKSARRYRQADLSWLTDDPSLWCRPWSGPADQGVQLSLSNLCLHLALRRVLLCRLRYSGEISIIEQFVHCSPSDRHCRSCQFVWLVLYQTKNGEYWATLALLPISMLVLVWGAFAAHREAHILMVSHAVTPLMDTHS